MIEVIGGISWQVAPSARQHSLKESGDAWYVSGIERVETKGTAGWRHTERTLYLNLNGAWQRAVEYFPTQDAALDALRSIIGIEEDKSDTSPFALAFQKANKNKNGK